MPAAQYDLVIDQGSDFEISITIEEDGSPMSLTGYGARASMRPNYESGTVHNFSSSITNSTVKIEMAHTVTDDITAGTYVYDVEIYHTGNNAVTRILQGKAKVTREVTRA